MSEEIHVFGDWIGLRGPRKIGLLRSNRVKNRETFSFEYDQIWLEDSPNHLDPELQLFSGPQYLPSTERKNFSVFLDSCPDRWGRILLKRNEAINARKQGRAERTLVESDFLMGLADIQRMGGLRFKRSAEGPFEAPGGERDVPPFASLRELEAAAWHIEDESIPDDMSERWLAMLLAPGSSLGGARPKATVRDDAGNLFIAKFPKPSDEIDKGLWEFIVHTLAARANIDLAEATVERLGQQHHTFITKRFDRVLNTTALARRHFASAMTMIGRSDGTGSADGASYLELVEFLIQHGSQVDRDLQQLWRRIVFSMMISNTDDHLRNHGFILQPDGWTLSPAYDLNPEPDGVGLHLNVSENDNSLDLELALSVAAYFRLSPKEAKAIVAEVLAAVRSWRGLAKELGIKRPEQQRMSKAFRLAD